MFAASGFGVARSTDGGATWTDSFPSLGIDERVWHVVVGRQEGNQRRVYAVGSRVWYSLDAGLTWWNYPQSILLGARRRMVQAKAHVSVAVHPANPAVVYLVVICMEKAKRKVQPHRMTDDLGREAMAMIRGDGGAHQSSMPHENLRLHLRRSPDNSVGCDRGSDWQLINASKLRILLRLTSARNLPSRIFFRVTAFSFQLRRLKPPDR
jgi:hypothetical protein